jgi:phosphoserine phosphatase
MLFATLIAAEPLTGEGADALTHAVASAGGSVEAAEWVEPSHVLRLSTVGIDAATLRTVLVGAGHAVDVIVRAFAAPMPRLMVSDMDSTMISAECIDELADFAGIKDQVAAITDRAMAGELDFEAALRERVALLAGLSEQDIADCLAGRVAPMPGARTLVATLKAHGVRTILVSGGFDHFANPVGAMIGFDDVVANQLEIRSGHLTGGLLGRIVDAAVKAERLRSAAHALGIAHAETLALGDGANDVPMLRAAGLGIAYHAKAAAIAAADAHIAHGDLTAVLHALGIARDKWVTD